MCFYLCCRSQTSRPKWTPSRAPNLCRLLLLPAFCLWPEEDHLSCYPPPGCERSQSHLTICPEPCTPHNAPSVSSQQVTRAPTTQPRFMAGVRLLLPLGTVISTEAHHKVLSRAVEDITIVEQADSFLFLFCGLDRSMDENPSCEFHVIKPAEEDGWGQQTSHLHLQLFILWILSEKRDGGAAAACVYILHPCVEKGSRKGMMGAWHPNHKVSPSLIPFFPSLMVNRVWILSVLVFTDSSWQTCAFLKSLSRVFYLKKGHASVNQRAFGGSFVHFLRGLGDLRLHRKVGIFSFQTLISWAFGCFTHFLDIDLLCKLSD